MENLVSVKKASQELCVNKDKIKQLVKSNLIKWENVSGQLFVDLEEVKEIMNIKTRTYKSIDFNNGFKGKVIEDYFYNWENVIGYHDNSINSIIYRDKFLNENGWLLNPLGIQDVDSLEVINVCRLLEDYFPNIESGYQELVKVITDSQLYYSNTPMDFSDYSIIEIGDYIVTFYQNASSGYTINKIIHKKDVKFKKDFQLYTLKSREEKVLDGIIKDYYDNGTLKRVTTYNNNLLHGLNEVYSENGTLKVQNYYINGVLIKSMI